MNLNILVVVSLLNLLACSSMKPNFEITNSQLSGKDFAKSFSPSFAALGIALIDSPVFEYRGNDLRIFAWASDKFYLERPGFCPLAENAFLFTKDQLLFATVAAKGKNIGVFVYDRTTFPALRFTYLSGESQKALKTVQCRNVGVTKP